MTNILDHITVLELATGVAGPSAAQTLSDFGAAVIKVEPPDGDPVRHWPGPRLEGGDSAAFLALNRNKQSVALDLSHPPGRAAVRALAAKADVVIADSDLSALDLDAAELRAANPALIYALIDPALPDGTAGRDALHQAASGYGSINGLPEGPPAKAGLPIIELTAANSLVQAVLAALYAREDSGEGQAVTVGLFRNAVAMTYFYGMAYQITGDPPQRHGNGSPAAAPIGVFQAADGPLQMTLGGERVWRKFVENIIEKPEWLTDPRYATNSARVANQEQLRREIEAIFATQPRDAWVDAMRAGGVPGGPIRTVGEAVDSGEVQDRGLVGTAPHSGGHEVPVALNPIRFAKTPVRHPMGAPLLGEHTAAIAAKYGLRL
jgi:crotonobetainyl-CoA:carnitine CoA-transferase CaiB-like acyl-CoA transferase